MTYCRSAPSVTARRALRGTLALCFSAILALVATSAHAGGSGHGYRGHDGYSYGRGHGYRYGRSARYNRGYHRGYRHGRRHRSSNRGAYLAGGLILGSVITHALTRPRYQEKVIEYRSEPSYIGTRSYQTRSYEARAEDRAGSISRRLFRDRDGNCYERETNADGDELLIELPERDCDW
jgi:hypothetical protein